MSFLLLAYEIHRGTAIHAKKLWTFKSSHTGFRTVLFHTREPKTHPVEEWLHMDLTQYFPCNFEIVDTCITNCDLI